MAAILPRSGEGAKLRKSQGWEDAWAQFVSRSSLVPSALRANSSRGRPGSADQEALANMSTASAETGRDAVAAKGVAWSRAHAAANGSSASAKKRRRSEERR